MSSLLLKGFDTRPGRRGESSRFVCPLRGRRPTRWFATSGRPARHHPPPDTPGPAEHRPSASLSRQRPAPSRAAQRTTEPRPGPSSSYSWSARTVRAAWATPLRNSFFPHAVAERRPCAVVITVQSPPPCVLASRGHHLVIPGEVSGARPVPGLHHGPCGSLLSWASPSRNGDVVWKSIHPLQACRHRSGGCRAMGISPAHGHLPTEPGASRRRAPFARRFDACGAVCDHPRMSTWGGLPSQNGAVLIRQFAVLSLVIVGLITAALCVVISHYLKADLLEREWTTTRTSFGRKPCRTSRRRISRPPRPRRRKGDSADSTRASPQPGVSYEEFQRPR